MQILWMYVYFCTKRVFAKTTKYISVRLVFFLGSDSEPKQIQILINSLFQSLFCSFAAF